MIFSLILMKNRQMISMHLRQNYITKFALPLLIISRRGKAKYLPWHVRLVHGPFVRY